jgi:hypothetical protein
MEWATTTRRPRVADGARRNSEDRTEEGAAQLPSAGRKPPMQPREPAAQMQPCRPIAEMSVDGLLPVSMGLAVGLTWWPLLISRLARRPRSRYVVDDRAPASLPS